MVLCSEENCLALCILAMTLHAFVNHISHNKIITWYHHSPPPPPHHHHHHHHHGHHIIIRVIMAVITIIVIITQFQPHGHH